MLWEVRAEHAAFRTAELETPWTLTLPDSTPLQLVTMLEGHASLVDGAAQAIDVPERAVALLSHPSGATLVDHGVKPSAVVVTTEYRLRDDIARRLLTALPPVLVVPDDAMECPIFDVILQELEEDRPGSQLVLDRALDILLLTTLREWFELPQAQTPLWYRATSDATVGTALRLMHERPAHPWSVQELADEVAVSRAHLSKTFTALVGEPPIKYLTGWRIALAADLLRDPETTVAAVASRVGFSTPYALSEAFVRVRGHRPSDGRP